ncbi:unnamed protein product [Pylaiella littoralis]
MVTTSGRAPARRKAVGSVGRKAAGEAKAGGSNAPLAGVVVYVDAFLDDRSPMREEYGNLLRNLGADVRARLPKKMAGLTHLVWKGGNEGTAQRASDAGVTLVSPTWVHACHKGGGRAAEKGHPAAFIPALYGLAAKKKPQARRKPTMEPTFNEWQDVDNLDLCLSSSQRDPPDLPTEDDEVVGHNSGSSSRGGGNRGAAAKPTGKAPSNRAECSATGVPNLGDISLLSPILRKVGERAAGIISSKPRPTSLGSPKPRTYGNGGASRLSAESAALGKRRVGFRRGGGAGGSGGDSGVIRGSVGGKSGGGGFSSSEEEENSSVDIDGPARECDAGDATEVDDDLATDVNYGGAAAAKNLPGAAATAAAGVDLSTTAIEDDDDDGGYPSEAAADTDLEKTIMADDVNDLGIETTNATAAVTTGVRVAGADTDVENATTPTGGRGASVATTSRGGVRASGNERATTTDDKSGKQQLDHRSTPISSAAAAVTAREGAGSPLTPSAKAVSAWQVGGRGLLGRGPARKSGKMSGLGSAGRVTEAAALKSPGLYVEGGRGGGGGGSIGRTREPRRGSGFLSHGADSAVFEMSDGEETERTVLDSTDCDAKAARGRVSQTEADDSSPEESGAEDDPASAVSISRKRPGRTAQGNSGGSGDGGGGRGRQESFLSPSPSPSPRLAAEGRGGGGGNRCITPAAGTRMRGSSKSNTTMREPESAARGGGGAPTPGSGYAADFSAGPARNTKGRARTRPAAVGGGGGGGGGDGGSAGTRRGAEAETEVWGAGGSWVCGSCTLKNKSKERKCTMCGARGPRKPPRLRAARAGTDSTAFADGGFSSPPADQSGSSVAVADGGELRPSCGGEEGRGESGASAGVAAAAAAAADDSPSGDWEGYDLMGRTSSGTASSSAKSSRVLRPLAPASNRKPLRSKNAADGDGDGGSCSGSGGGGSFSPTSTSPAAASPSVEASSPAVTLPGPRPPQAEGVSGSSRRAGGASAVSRAVSGAVIDGAGLREVARGQDHDGCTPDDDDRDEDKGEIETEMEACGGVGAATAAAAEVEEGSACPGRTGTDTPPEESDTDTVQKFIACRGIRVGAFPHPSVCPLCLSASPASRSFDGGSSIKAGGVSHNPETAVAETPGGMMGRNIDEDTGSGSGVAPGSSRGGGVALENNASLISLAVIAESIHGGSTVGDFSPSRTAVADAATMREASVGEEEEKEEEEEEDGLGAATRIASARRKNGTATAAASGPGRTRRVSGRKTRAGGGGGRGGGAEEAEGETEAEGEGGGERVSCSSPPLCGESMEAESSAATAGGGVAGFVVDGDGDGERKERSTVVDAAPPARRSSRRRSARTALGAGGGAEREAAPPPSPAVMAAAPVGGEAAHGRGNKRRSSRGAVAAAASPTSTARVAAVYAKNDGPAATTDSIDEVAAAVCAILNLPIGDDDAQQEVRHPMPPQQQPSAPGDDAAVAAMISMAGAGAGAGAEDRDEKTTARGRITRGVEDGSAATAVSTASGEKGEGADGECLPGVGVKRRSRGGGEETDGAGKQAGRGGATASGRRRASAGSHTGSERRGSPSSSVAKGFDAGDDEGTVSRDKAAAAATATATATATDADAAAVGDDDLAAASDDNLVFDDEEDNLPVGDDEDDGDGEPASTAAPAAAAFDEIRLGDEGEGGGSSGRSSDTTAVSAVVATAAEAAAIGEDNNAGTSTNSRSNKANAKRGRAVPEKRGKKRPKRSRWRQLCCRRHGGRGPKRTGQRTAGKRKRGEGGGIDPRGGGGGGGGGGDGAAGKGEEGGKDNELRGVVRVVFSGLQPGDRQAATSVVRSLSKGHRPAGSGVCASDTEAFTHLVIPDESRRTLKVLFALCAPLSPNGRPPVVVTVSWLYASLEKGFFVDSESFRPKRYRGPSPEGGAVLGEEDAGKDPAAAETCSISSSLLAGELVALGGISDPPPQVAENLARAAGAQIARSLEEATLLLVESEPELEVWVQRRKKLACSSTSTSTSTSTTSSRHGSSSGGSGGSDSGDGGGGGGGGGGGASKSSARLGTSTPSTRDASLGTRRGRRFAPGVGVGKKRGAAVEDAAAAAAGWGDGEEKALEALKKAAGVVRLPWLYDSVERGVLVDKEDFLVGAEGAQPSGTSQEDVGASQEW